MEKNAKITLFQNVDIILSLLKRHDGSAYSDIEISYCAIDPDEIVLIAEHEIEFYYLGLEVGKVLADQQFS